MSDRAVTLRRAVEIARTSDATVRVVQVDPDATAVMGETRSRRVRYFVELPASQGGQSAGWLRRSPRSTTTRATAESRFGARAQQDAEQRRTGRETVYVELKVEDGRVVDATPVSRETYRFYSERADATGALNRARFATPGRRLGTAVSRLRRQLSREWIPNAIVRSVQGVVMLAFPRAGFLSQPSNLRRQVEGLADAARDPDTRTPPYYEGVSVHGYEPLGAEQAAFQRPWMKMLWAMWGSAGKAGFTTDAFDRLRLPNPEGGRILSLGAGTGETSEALLGAFPRASRVVGVDLSPAMVGLARDRFRDPRYEFLHRAAEETRLASNDFGLVYAGFLFHELPPMATRAILREALRVTASGGTFVVQDMNPDNPSIRRQTELPPHVRRMIEPYLPSYLRLDLRQEMLNAGFTSVEEISTPHATAKIWVAHKDG